jgi:hypothetical protein
VRTNRLIETLMLVSEFLYALTHHHPVAAVIGGFSLVVAGRGQYLARIFIAILLICLLHDWITGQISMDLK